MLAMLATWLANHAFPRKFMVAYSGGQDSHVLLHALWQLQQLPGSPAFELSAIHINHGLHLQASAWENHCQHICDEYGIALTTVALKLMPAKGESVEALARDKRYQAFAKFTQSDETLLTAHMQEDQAETVLLQLMRGAGVRGLSAIAANKSLSYSAIQPGGRLARPLLNIAKKQIADYAKQQQLAWIDDPSNGESRFRRNRIRQQILPALEQISPGFARCAARSAQHCAQTQVLLDEMLQADLLRCLGPKPQTLNLNALTAFSSLKQQFILRHWFAHCQVLSPPAKKLMVILEQMIPAKIDASPCVNWGNHQLKRYQDLLYLLPFTPLLVANHKPIQWDLSSPLTLHDGSIWQAKRVQGKGIHPKLMQGSLMVRFREGGERCAMPGKKSHPLKKILQEQKIPVWQRAALPLFYQNNELVAVAALFICHGWQVQNQDEQGWLIYQVN